MQIRHILITDHFKSSPLKPLNQIKPNLVGMVPGWVPFKFVSNSPTLHSRWLLLLKIEISSISIAALVEVKMTSNFNCSYMARNSLTYILGFSVKYFFSRFIPIMQVRHILIKKSHLNLLLWNRWTKLNQTWQEWSLGRSLSKLCPTAPPSIQDGCCY